MQYYFEIITEHPYIYIMDYPKLIVSNWKEESISVQRVKHCVNFSGSKPRTPLIVFSCILSNSEKYGKYVWTY